MRPKTTAHNHFIVLAFGVLLYGSLFVLFFALFSIEYPQIINLSRTAASTMFTFPMSMSLLLRVYGGYNIHKQKSKPIVHSLIITTLLTDLITYMQFSIMNTSARFSSQIIRFANPWTMLLIFALQTLTIVLLTYLGNFIYFCLTPPEQVCIVTGCTKKAGEVLLKIKKYKKQYQLGEIIHFDDKDLYDTLAEYDTIFIVDVPVEKRVAMMKFCYAYSKNIYFVPESFDVISVCAQHVLLDDKSFVSFEMGQLRLDQRLCKRSFDLCFSLFLLVLTAPLMLLCAIGIKCLDGGRVLFSQKRATKDGEIFTIYKFRTMQEGVLNQSAKINDSRITNIGFFLRSTRLDELPQLWNIFKGDMSFVGPRPEMLENIEKYTKKLPEFGYRLRVKAGLTGFAQIMGKYNTTPQDKLFLDLLYIENYSIWLDVKLLMQTVLVFFKKDSTEGFSTIPLEIELGKYQKDKQDDR